MREREWRVCKAEECDGPETTLSSGDGAEGLPCGGGKDLKSEMPVEDTQLQLTTAWDHPAPCRAASSPPVPPSRSVWVRSTDRHLGMGGGRVGRTALTSK